MNNDEDEDEGKKKEPTDENKRKISKVSLKTKTERTNIVVNEKSNVKLTNVVKSDNDNAQIEQENCIGEGPGTSREPNNEVTLLYKTVNYNHSVETVLSRGHIEDSQIDEPQEEPKPIFAGLSDSIFMDTSCVTFPPNYQMYGSTCMDTGFATFPPPYTIENTQYVIQEDSLLNIVPPASAPVVLYSAPPLAGAPPTYSAVMRIGPIDIQPRRSHRCFGRREIQLQPSAPFIAPAPPPAYGDNRNTAGTAPARALLPCGMDIQESLWGPDPVPVVCPSCNNYVMTHVRVRRSNITHFSALALCICGCWPCCLLPYCMKSCKSTYHECPICRANIGLYNPW